MERAFKFFREKNTILKRISLKIKYGQKEDEEDGEKKNKQIKSNIESIFSND